MSEAELIEIENRITQLLETAARPQLIVSEVQHLRGQVNMLQEQIQVIAEDARRLIAIVRRSKQRVRRAGGAE